MIFFFDSDGNLFRSVPENVYQGSNNANKLYVVAPFANSATVSVAFRLPNGKNTSPALLTLTPATGELQGLIDSYNQEGLCVWALNIPNWVTNFAGNVTAQFYIMGGGNLLATASAQFPVLQGVSPSVPADADLQSVLDAFTALLGDWETYKEQISSLVDGLYDKKAIVAIFTCASNTRSVTLNEDTLTLDRIDWGDGTTNTELSHTYALAGTYVCKIYATAWTDNGEYGAFANVAQLTEVFLSNALPAIPDVTFINCQNLQKVHFADNTTIGEQAFQECYNLAEVDLPKKITSIGYRAFYNSGVETLVLWNTVTSVGADAFTQTAIDKIYFKGFKSEFPLDLDDFISPPTIYYLSEGKESDNETEINTIKSYIPTGTSAANKLVNEGNVDAVVAQAMEDANFVSTTKETPQAVQGDFTIGGDAVIVGNLTVEGTEYINDVETIQSENTLIITNYSEEGAALTTLSGVVAITGEKENDEYPAIAVAVYDPADETLKLGTGTYADGEFTPDGDLQPLATRRESTDMTDGNLVKWNAEDNTLEDAGVAITAADKAAWDGKQDALTFDDAPTQDSTNPVKSGGVYTALSGKVDKSSTADRIYGTNGSGNQTTIPYSTAPNNGLIYRDANGRAQVEAPSANKDIANKNYVDTNLPVIQDWTV